MELPFRIWQILFNFFLGLNYMPKETDRDFQKAQIRRIEKEYAEIFKKYYLAVDMDSGLQDALDYASLKLEEWRVRNLSAHPEAFEPDWAEAEKEADRIGGSHDKLRELIRQDAQRILDIGKAGLAYKTAARGAKALFNLADSF